MIEHVQEGALVLLVLDRVVQIVRAKSGKSNGHSEVRPKDAFEFWQLQTGMDRKLDELLERTPRRDH